MGVFTGHQWPSPQGDQSLEVDPEKHAYRSGQSLLLCNRTDLDAFGALVLLHAIAQSHGAVSCEGRMDVFAIANDASFGVFPRCCYLRYTLTDYERRAMTIG